MLEDPGDISAVMGYLPHPGYGYKGVPQGLIIPIGPQSKPLREPNLAPKLEGMFLQLRPQLQETLLRPKKADVAESVAAFLRSGSGENPRRLPPI